MNVGIDVEFGEAVSKTVCIYPLCLDREFIWNKSEEELVEYGLLILFYSYSYNS